VEDAVLDAILADRDRRRGRPIARLEKRIGLQKRAVGVSNLVRPAVREVEPIHLNPPAIVEIIPHARAEEAGRRRTESIVFRQRPRPEIAIAEPSEPSGFLAEREVDRADDIGSARDEVPWRIANLRLRETGKRVEGFDLGEIKAKEPRSRDSYVGFKVNPGNRPVIIGPFDANAAGRPARLGVSGISGKNVLGRRVKAE
jgi:hypothetical protein